MSGSYTEISTSKSKPILIFYLCYKIFGKCTEVCCSRRSLLLTIDFIHFLYRGFVISKGFIRFFVCGDQNLGSLNREFVIERVRYIGGIYKRFIVQNPRGTAFGSLYRDVRYTRGSLYRESTVLKKLMTSVCALRNR